MRFVRAAGANEFTDTTAARLTLLAYLHDFGKLNAGFQFKVRPRNGLTPRGPGPAGHIAEALLCFDQADICSLLGLPDIVDEWGAGVVPLAQAMLAHHGRPARRPTRSGSGPSELWKPFAGYDPRATAKLLSERGRSWFPDAFSPGPDMPDTPALAHLFAGIVTLADQLGSDDEAFRYPAPLSAPRPAASRRRGCCLTQHRGPTVPGAAFLQRIQSSQTPATASAREPCKVGAGASTTILQISAIRQGDIGSLN